jgi:hypothetical protein
MIAVAVIGRPTTACSRFAPLALRRRLTRAVRHEVYRRGKEVHQQQWSLAIRFEFAIHQPSVVKESVMQKTPASIAVALAVLPRQSLLRPARSSQSYFSRKEQSYESSCTTNGQ